MIWFYIAGFVSGAAGMVLYSRWWVQRHATIVKIEDIKEETDKND